MQALWNLFFKLNLNGSSQVHTTWCKTVLWCKTVCISHSSCCHWDSLLSPLEQPITVQYVDIFTKCLKDSHSVSTKLSHNYESQLCKSQIFMSQTFLFHPKIKTLSWHMCSVKLWNHVYSSSNTHGKFIYLLQCS